MVVVKMTGIGQLVDEGTYPVTLTKVSEKKTQAGDDMVTFQATINGSDTDMEGRSLFRNFVISSDPEKDISGILFYLQQCLLAFDADPDDVTGDTLDPVALGKTLYGNRAQATVTHAPDKNDPKIVRASVEFKPSDF